MIKDKPNEKRSADEIARAKQKLADSSTVLNQAAHQVELSLGQIGDGQECGMKALDAALEKVSKASESVKAAAAAYCESK